MGLNGSSDLRAVMQQSFAAPEHEPQGKGLRMQFSPPTMPV